MSKVTATRITDRLLRDTCECGGTAAYVVDGKRLCLVAAEQAALGTIPALPEGFQVIIQLDPVGDERMHSGEWESFWRMRQPMSCQTVYRILPDTAERGHAWVKGQPWTDDAHHGYTLAYALLSIRETIGDAFALPDPYSFREATREATHAVVSNYGWSLLAP